MRQIWTSGEKIHQNRKCEDQECGPLKPSNGERKKKRNHEKKKKKKRELTKRGQEKTRYPA